MQTYAEIATTQLMGDMLKKLGQAEEAEKMYESGRALALRQLQDRPDDDTARANLGTMELCA